MNQDSNTILDQWRKKQKRWIHYNPVHRNNFFLLPLVNHTQITMISIFMDMALSARKESAGQRKPAEQSPFFFERSFYYILEGVISDEYLPKDVVSECYLDFSGLCQKFSLYAYQPQLWQNSEFKMKSPDREVFRFICLKADEAEMFRMILEKALVGELKNGKDFLLEEAH